mgnify:CR=1 FL=1
MTHFVKTVIKIVVNNHLFFLRLALQQSLSHSQDWSLPCWVTTLIGSFALLLMSCCLLVCLCACLRFCCRLVVSLFQRPRVISINLHLRRLIVWHVSCFTISLYPGSTCQVLVPGQNLTSARLCIPSASPNVTCLNMSSVAGAALASVLGDIVSVQSLGRNFSKLNVGFSCAWGVSPSDHDKRPHLSCFDCVNEVESSNTCNAGMMISPTFANGSLACGDGYEVVYNNESIILDMHVLSPYYEESADPDIDVQVTTKGPAPPSGRAQSPEFSVMSALATAANGGSCLPCVQGDIAALISGNDVLYCQVTSVGSDFVVADLFCSSSDCDSKSCSVPAEKMYLGFPSTLELKDSSLLRYSVRSRSYRCDCPPAQMQLELAF